MSVSVNTSGNAYHYLQSLLQQQQQSASGGTAAGSTDPVSELLEAFYPSGNGDTPAQSPATTAGDSCCGCLKMTSETMASLITMQAQRSDPVASQAQHVFSEFDDDGNGAISEAECEGVFGPNADMSKVDDLFNALDANGDGGVSLDELTAAARFSRAQHRHLYQPQAAAGGGLSDLMASLDVTGASSKTITNADGSSTTSITYSDGSTVQMTTPAGSPNSANTPGNAPSDRNVDHSEEYHEPDNRKREPRREPTKHLQGNQPTTKEQHVGKRQPPLEPETKEDAGSQQA